MNKACCNLADKEDKCHSGVPVDCDYDCAIAYAACAFPPILARAPYDRCCLSVRM